MCTTKREVEDAENTVPSSDSDDSSDVSMSASSSDEDPEDDNPEPEEMEEEDEVIKAIRKEAEKKRDHPPPISCDDFVTDISFHPNRDLLAVATIVGDTILYKYTNEENTIERTLELHTKSCRDIEFSADGKMLFSVSKDMAIMLSDVESGNLVRFYEGAHDVPLYCITIVDENIFATGDEDGCVKLWDSRQSTPIYKTKKNEDFISDMVTDEENKYLVCSSGDGSLTTIDLQNRKIFMQSEEYDEELTCLGLFRTETKLLAGSSKGKLFLYNWSEFGLHSDEFPGPKTAINDLIPITENIVVTACEDGALRAAHLFPHRYIGIVGQHDLSVENVDICNNGQFIASTSHDDDIRFWNIGYFENFDKMEATKKHGKKGLKNNLPSSKMQNASDFFSGLC